MTDDTANTEQSPVAADCPNERLVIQRHELDKLEDVRLELHEIATHNPQIEQYILTITSKLWPIIHRKREAV